MCRRKVVLILLFFAQFAACKDEPQSDVDLQPTDAAGAAKDAGTPDTPADLKQIGDVIAQPDVEAPDAGRIPDSNPTGADTTVDRAVTIDAGNSDTPLAPGDGSGPDAAADLASDQIDVGGTIDAANRDVAGLIDPSLGFLAWPAAIFSGESSTLSWDATGATALSLAPGIGSVLGKTSQVVNPTQTTIYTLTANGTISAQVTVTVLQGVFSQTGNMTAQRNVHTATLLQDGRVLVAGGEAYSADLASAELFDPASGKFSATGDLVGARDGHTATLLQDGRVLLTGGFNGSVEGSEKWLASAEIYDPAAGKFTSTRDMSSARVAHTATLLQDGKVLIAGGNPGLGSSGPQSSTELYDPATGKFAATGAMTVAREDHTAALLLDGTVLIAGGSDGSKYLSSAELYDPKTGKFSATGSLNGARSLHSATLLRNGMVLIAGGEDDKGCLATAELYDAGKFTPTASLLSATEWHTATLLQDGKVLIAGGSNNLLPLARASLYDPVLGMFTSTGNLRVGRELHAATLLKNGSVLVTGGFTGTDYLASAELFK